MVFIRADMGISEREEARKAKGLICSVDGCDKGQYMIRLAMCRYHGLRFIRYDGNPDKRTRNSPNEILVSGDQATMYLYDNAGNKVSETVFDAEDVERVRRHKWCLTAKGYVKSSRAKNGRGWFLHRFLMNDAYNIIDHADRNPLNNRKSNLRPASSSQNQRNGEWPRGRTGYKGVVYAKGRNKPYVARLWVEGRSIHIANFQTPEEAAAAYDSVKLQVFHDSPEFTRINSY